MADDKRIDRRRSMDALFGGENEELSEEFFEEKLKEMGEGPKITKGMVMKHQKLAEDPLTVAEKAESGRIVRDEKMSALFGEDDIVPDEEELEEKVRELENRKPPVDLTVQTEYEKWLEEGLKKDKGYGEKVAYEGQTAEEKDSYTGSTYESYDKWQAETQEMIRRLKARDAMNKARDDNLHDALYLTAVFKGGSGVQHSGDSDRFFGLILSGVWFMVSSLAVMGLFYAFGVRGLDLLIPFGLGSVTGAIIRYNGKEGYTLSESLKYGAVEVAIFISTVISWLLSLVIGGDLIFAIVVAGVFAVGGEYHKQRIFFARSKKESRRRTGPFFVCALAAAILIFIVKLIMMLQGM